MTLYSSSIRSSVRCWCLAGLALLGLVACGVAEQPSAAMTSVPAPSDVATIAPAQTGEAAMNRPTAQNIPATLAPTGAGAWQSYRNEQAGFSTEYPAGWSANEQDQGNGSFTVTFTPGGGGSNITVIVQPGEIVAEDTEVPNTRCQSINVGGRPARRCTDTISFTTTTTVAGHGRTYIITATSKRMGVDTYQHFLDSFMITSSRPAVERGSLRAAPQTTPFQTVSQKPEP
jgi:hypothetical protein